MKPFNLERALAGDPVVTRDGKAVAQLINFVNTNTSQPLFGVAGEHIYSWYRDGSFMHAVTSSNDLFMAPKKRTVWVNLYPQAITRGATYHEAEQAANDYAGHLGGNRIGGKAWPLEISE